MYDVRNIFINKFNYIHVAGNYVAIAVALAVWQQRAQLLFSLALTAPPTLLFNVAHSYCLFTA